MIGWGHDDSVRVQLTMMDSYEEREDAPVAAFRARLASRNATQGVMAPPPVHRGEVQLRVKMGQYGEHDKLCGRYESASTHRVCGRNPHSTNCSRHARARPACHRG